VPTFPEVSGQNPVSGETSWAFRAKGHESCGESLLDEFSISEIWSASVQRPVAFPQRPVRIRNFEVIAVMGYLDKRPRIWAMMVMGG
jgi:hypothetical protein